MHNKSELSAIIADSIKFWEVRRVLFNLILALITLLLLYVNINLNNFDFAELLELLARPLIRLFKLAIAANILYCSAYIVDVFVQLSDFRSSWLKYRWILFLSGTAFASVLTAYFVVILFDFMW